MSENYVKKYDVGQIKLDLPYANYIHELPLLSFGDVQHTVNLSLVFNYGAHKEGIKPDYTGEVNPFYIASGYKLNLQKRLIIDNNDNPLYLIDEAGKKVNINEGTNVFTFDDDSMRILRKEERTFTPFAINPPGVIIPTPITDTYYILEYPDYSKEEYDSYGCLAAVYDKYGTQYLHYSYLGDKVSEITYRDTKKIVLGYTNDVLSSITYRCNNVDACSIGVSIGNDGCGTVTNNSEGVKYSFALSGKNFEVTATEKETIEGQTNNILYYNRITFSLFEILISEGKNDTETNRILYSANSSLEELDIDQLDYINVINSDGVTTRVECGESKTKYYYEIVGNDLEFYQGQYMGTVHTMRTENSNDSLAIRFEDGINIDNIGNDYSSITTTSLKSADDTGYFVLSGWAKNNIDEFSILINEKSYTIELMYNPVQPIWKFFAVRVDPNTISGDSINIKKGLQGSQFYDSELKLTGLKLTFHPSPLPIFINKATGSEHYIDNETFRDIIPEGSYDTISIAELMKYKQDTIKGVENKVLFYNNGKNVICGITNPTLCIDGAHISIHDLDIGTKYVKSGNTYVSRTSFNTNNMVISESVTNSDNTYTVNTHTLDSNLDLISSVNENGVTVNYTRSNGLITSEYVDGLYTRTTSYGTNIDGDPTVIQTDEFGNSTIYTLDKIWGGIKSVALPNGTVIEDTYDDDMCALLNRKFANGRNNSIGYSEGNVSSMSSGDLNYQFGYTDKGELASITQNGADIEEHIYDDENNKITSHYPAASGSVYSPIVHLDKYGRTTEVENVSEITYDVHPVWYLDETLTENYYTYGNAPNDAKLAQFTDKLKNETTKYGYDKKHLIKIAKFNSNSETKIAEEEFTYDKADRLTTDICTYDKSNSKSVKTVILYEKSEDDPCANNIVNRYSYYLNGNTSPIAQTGNDFDSYNRITAKYQAINGKEFVKNITYDKTRPQRLLETLDGQFLCTTDYAYDGMGRIASVTADEITTQYTYDNYGQLTKEVNHTLDKTFQYVYNEIGNITSVITTPKNGGSSTTTTFTYGNTNHPDRLTSYDGKAITYDATGCPVSYDGKTYTWTRGKLSKVSSGSTASGKHTYNFTYNALGQRVEKSYSYFKKNTATGGFGEAAVVYTTSRNAKYYYDHSGRLIAENRVENFSDFTQESRRIEYLYDESGMIGFRYIRNGVDKGVYYYQRNLQGDVVTIYDANCNVKAVYKYDAFGNCTVSNTANSDIADINPIRYRGYYYDTETGLYYLNARYYNPEWRRFISPDDTSYLDPESVNGLNLYCYCNNDPVNFVDPSGHMPNWLKWLIGGVAFAGAIVLTAVSGGALAPVFIGMGSSILSGGLIEGAISAFAGESFGDGFLNGAANGAMCGGIFAMIGSSIGAIKYVISAKGAVKGTQHFTTITKGQMFDRYGRLTGKYITDLGTPITKLALPSTNTGVKTTLMATRNFRVITGTIADAFGNTGGGIQYFMRYSIETLIKMGWLVVIES